MSKLFKKAHTYLYLSSVVLLFLPFYPFLYFYSKNPEKYFHQIVLCRKWISTLSARLVGFRFKIEFEEDIDWTVPYVLCPNHTSILDITALTSTCPSDFSFMGKIELLKNFVTAMFFKSIDIAVDRSSKISSFKAYKKADQMLKNGRSIVIFPEGKIDDLYPPVLHEFKSGSFRLAIDNKIPILPIVIKDAWKCLWDDGLKKGSRPGRIHIKVLKPIYTDNLTPKELDQLQQDVYKLMQQNWIYESKS